MSDQNEHNEQDEFHYLDRMKYLFGQLTKKQDIKFPADSIVTEPKNETIFWNRFYVHLEPERCAVFNARDGKQFTIESGGVVSLPPGFKPGSYTLRYVDTSGQLTRMGIIRGRASDDWQVGLDMGIVWSIKDAENATRQNATKLLRYYVNGAVIAYIESKKHDELVNMAQIDFEVEGNTENFVTAQALPTEEIAKGIYLELAKTKAFTKNFNLKVIRIFKRIPDHKRAKLIREQRQELAERESDLFYDLSQIEREKKVAESEKELLDITSKLKLEQQKVDLNLKLLETKGEFSQEVILQNIERMKNFVTRENKQQEYDQQKQMALIDKLTEFADIVSQPGVNPQLAAEVMREMSEMMELLLKTTPGGVEDISHLNELPGDYPPPGRLPRDTRTNHSGGVPWYDPDEEDD